MSSLVDRCAEDEGEARKNKNGNPFCLKGGCDKPLIECFRQKEKCIHFHDECTEEQNALKEIERKRIEKELVKTRKRLERLERVSRFLNSDNGNTVVGCSLGTFGCFAVIAACMVAIGAGILLCKYAWLFITWCWNLTV